MSEYHLHKTFHKVFIPHVTKRSQHNQRGQRTLCGQATSGHHYSRHSSPLTPGLLRRQLRFLRGRGKVIRGGAKVLKKGVKILKGRALLSLSEVNEDSPCWAHSCTSQNIPKTNGWNKKPKPRHPEREAAFFKELQVQIIAEARENSPPSSQLDPPQPVFPEKRSSWGPVTVGEQYRKTFAWKKKSQVHQPAPPISSLGQWLAIAPTHHDASRDPKPGKREAT